jgi:hypothetical protein
MVLTGAENGFAVLTGHSATDHGHCTADLTDFAMETDCGS